MSESVVNSYNWSAVAKADYGLWVAKYADYNPDYNFDMSRAGAKPDVKWWKFYGNKKAWLAYAGSKGKATIPAKEKVKQTVKKAVKKVAKTKTYKVKKGDNLSAIAAKYGTSWQANGGAWLVGPSTNTDSHAIITYFNGASSVMRIDGSTVASGNAGSNAMANFSVSSGAAGNSPKMTVSAIGIVSGDITSAAGFSALQSFVSSKWGLTL